MKALVIGAAGQLGAAMVARLGSAAAAGEAGGGRAYDVVAATRAEADLCDTAALLALVEAQRPDVVINCAAYNNVDGAEDDALAALEVNALAVRALAAACARVGATLVHYSTDFVFDGAAEVPYRETDRARPQSTYGASKLLGEWFAPAAPAHYVLRVESLFGGPAARSSIDKIVAAVTREEEARVFVDRVVTPSFVDDVVSATERLLEQRAAYGLYHCVNTGTATWWDVGVEIGRLLGVTPRLVPVKTADVVLKAKRPQYCALANDKLTAAIGPLPTWQDALARYLASRK